MTPKLFEKGLYWVKLRYVYRNPPAKILSCYLCTYNENPNTSMKKVRTDESKGTSKIEDARKMSNKLINLDKNDLPEEPTTCCMSGCANCVWLEYAEKMREYFKDGGERAIKEINERVNDPNIKAFLLQELRMKNS